VADINRSWTKATAAAAEWYIIVMHLITMRLNFGHEAFASATCQTALNIWPSSSSKEVPF